jgi:hypothetical protein
MNAAQPTADVVATAHAHARLREAMPLFRFHIYNDVETIDQEGKQFPDLSAARQHAIEGARDLMSAGVQRGQINLGDWIEVEDENSDVTVVPFHDALDVLTQRTQASPISR